MRCSRTAGPWSGAEFFDPSNSATYQTDPNRIRDYDATNKPWPEVVAELLGFYGFGMRWACSTDASGEPYDYLEVYRKDAAGPTDPKPIYLPETGSDLSTALVNVATMHAAFDYQAVANSFYIETAPERYEVSVILAPGYQPQAGDGTAANRVQFRKERSRCLERNRDDASQVSLLHRRRMRRRTLEPGGRPMADNPDRLFVGLSASQRQSRQPADLRSALSPGPKHALLKRLE